MAVPEQIWPEVKCHQNGKDLEVQNAVRSKGRKNSLKKSESWVAQRSHKDASYGGLGSLQCENMPNEAVLVADALGMEWTRDCKCALKSSQVMEGLESPVPGQKAPVKMRGIVSGMRPLNLRASLGERECLSKAKSQELDSGLTARVRLKATPATLLQTAGSWRASTDLKTQ